MRSRTLLLMSLSLASNPDEREMEGPLSGHSARRLPRLLLGPALALAACQHGPIHAGNQWRPLDHEHHYSIADLPAGELMPPGWMAGTVVRPFLQPDFAFAGSKSGEPPFDDARSLLTRLRMDPAK
jgi:hypothetical protein